MNHLKLKILFSNWNVFDDKKKVIRNLFVTLASCVSRLRRTIGWSHVVVKIGEMQRINAPRSVETSKISRVNEIENDSYNHAPWVARENWKYRKHTRSTNFSYQQALFINIRNYSWNSLLSSVRWTDSASLSFSKAYSQ
jgi:hypothetical protein